MSRSEPNKPNLPWPAQEVSSEWVDLMMKALTAALDGEPECAADALTEISEAGGSNAIYGACYGFAEVARGALTTLYGQYSPDTAQGDMWTIETLKPDEADPYETFAVRFIVSYANGDRDQSLALFNATFSSEEDHVASVMQLLATSASLVHTAVEARASR